MNPINYKLYEFLLYAFRYYIYMHENGIHKESIKRSEFLNKYEYDLFFLRLTIVINIIHHR